MFTYKLTFCQVPDHFAYLEGNQTAQGLPAYNYGNIAFTLISISNDTLQPNASRGIDPPTNFALNVSVYSWLSDNNLSALLPSWWRAKLKMVTSQTDLTERKKTAFSESMTVDFSLWNIGCSLYLEEVVAEIRGDNTLKSYVPTSSEVRPSRPFLRSTPNTTLERVWPMLLDTIDFMEAGHLNGDYGPGQVIPNQWFQKQLANAFNTAGATTLEKMLALESGLQNITSLAFALLVQQLRRQSDELGTHSKLEYAMISGTQEGVVYAYLHINITQLSVGLLSMALIITSFVVSTGVRSGIVATVNDMQSAGALDVIRLMRDSDLPALIGKDTVHSHGTDLRRQRAEMLSVKYVHLLRHTSPYISQRHP